MSAYTTGVVAVSPSTMTVEARPEGSEADYEAPARESLKVETSRTEDGSSVFAVSDPTTGIFGTGGSPIEAVEDLGLANKEHRDVLEAQEDLSPALQEQLRYLQRS